MDGGEQSCSIARSTRKQNLNSIVQPRDLLIKQQCFKFLPTGFKLEHLNFLTRFVFAPRSHLSFANSQPAPLSSRPFCFPTAEMLTRQTGAFQQVRSSNNMKSERRFLSLPNCSCSYQENPHSVEAILKK